MRRWANCWGTPVALRCWPIPTAPSSNASIPRKVAQPASSRPSSSTRRGLRKGLRGGDILTLLTISPEFANAVTLKGHVAQPLRYPYTPGMRIRDLIPDREALITPDFYRRKNLLVQVLEDEPADESRPGSRDRFDRERRNDGGRVGLPGARGERGTRDQPEVRDLDANGRPRSASRMADLEASERAKKTPAALFDELNWDYAVVERLNKSDLTTQVISFNLGRAVIQGDPQHNIELQSGDVVTVYSQKDIRVPVSRQTRLVSVEGEVSAPGDLPAVTRRDAQADAAARRWIDAAGLSLRPGLQSRGNAPAPDRQPEAGDGPAAGAVGHPGGARCGEPA